MNERAAPAPDPTRRPLALRGWALLVSLAGLLGFAGSASAADQTVTASSFMFDPTPVNINVGDTVTWNNAGGTHNVKFADQSSALLAPSPPGPAWPVSRRFDVAGTYSYVCQPHQAMGMIGTVTVTAAAPPPPGGGTPPPSPGPGDPGQPKTELKLRLKLSDATPAKGKRVRFFGSVRPAIEGRVLIQRRGRKGSYKTVAKAKLKEGTTSSTYSRRVRAVAGVYRARILATAGHEAANSSTRRVKTG
jgi:plastocyanin